MQSNSPAVQPTDRTGDEGDIARLLTSRWHLGSGDFFRCVTCIARDEKVVPDIDLLRVYSNPYHPEEDQVVGYELKLLKYHEGYKRIPMDPLYSGLGQVLCYFQYGVDRAELVLGFHSNCDSHPEHADALERQLKEVCEFLGRSVFAHFPYLCISMIRGDSRNYLLYKSDWENAVFSHDETAKLRRQCILRKQFVFRKG